MNEIEIIEMEMPDKSYSKSECLKYQGVTIFNDVTQKPCDGQYMVSGTILRFRNGLLHGGKNPDGLEVDDVDVPAYETDEGHIEYFENGLLHRVNAPAVISEWGEWEEWWNKGELILIRASGSSKAELEKGENS